MKPRRRPSDSGIISTAGAAAQLALFGSACPEKLAAMSVEDVRRRYRVSARTAESAIRAAAERVLAGVAGSAGQ